MKRTIPLVATLAGISGFATVALAQDGSGAGGAGAACGVMACGMVMYVLILAAVIALFVGIIVFVYRYIKSDATARGMANASSMAWLGLLGLLGLLIYLLQRPQGNVVPCPNCGKKRMQGLPRCPHCGNP